MAILNDSGQRTDYGTGALRDMPEDKGRCDLLPLDVVAEVINSSELANIRQYQQTGDHSYLVLALRDFADRSGMSLPKMFLEVSHQYEDGAKKYGEHNWEKGLPTWNFIDSGVRHFLKYLDGMTDEPHDRAFIWNMLGAIWTARNKPDMEVYPCSELSVEPAVSLNEAFDMLKIGPNVT